MTDLKNSKDLEILERCCCFDDGRSSWLLFEISKKTASRLKEGQGINRQWKTKLKTCGQIKTSDSSGKELLPSKSKKR